MNNDAHQVLRVYSVVASEPDNDRWLEIGKASPHQDGRGFDLVLEALPMNSRLVVRAQEETQAGAESAAEQRASYAQQIAAFERALIERCLTETGGSISGVMARLSIPRRTLNEKMQRLGIDRQRFVQTGGLSSRTSPSEQRSIDMMTPAAKLSKAR